MNYLPPRRSDGTIQTRRAPLPWPKDRPFRILSIDGGGICGVLPASILSELERRFLGGASISAYFDMIAGTSTGGIIALGLGKGLTAAKISNVYIERGAAIFPPVSFVGRVLRKVRHTHRYLYDRTALENELRHLLGDAVLDDAVARLCIPAFEGRHGEPWLYKTPHHPDYKKDRSVPMVTVGLATAAAPTYFEALPNHGYLMIDGGLWANNPIMNAVADALACFDMSRGQIRILSLGCGETSFRVDHAKVGGGLIQWRGIYWAAMRAQSLNALGQAYLLLGRDQITRLDAPESSNAIELDDYRRAREELPKLARALAEATGHDIAKNFLTNPAEKFTSVFNTNFA